jgi:hypothetical protein
MARRRRSTIVASQDGVLAAGAVIPGLLQGHQSTAQVGIVGGPVAALTQTAHEAGKISGTTVTVVVLPGLGQAKAELRSGKLAAVLIGDSEVLIKQQGFSSSRSRSSWPTSSPTASCTPPA